MNYITATARLCELYVMCFKPAGLDDLPAGEQRELLTAAKKILFRLFMGIMIRGKNEEITCVIQ